MRVEGGYQIHDYLKFQKSKVQILKEREQANRRQFKKRHGVTPDVTAPVSHARPTPTPKTEPVVRPLTPVPDPERDTPFAGPTDQGLTAADAARIALGKEPRRPTGEKNTG